MKEKINIKGMSCSACSASVERAVKKLDGVKSANVNLLAENMICVFDEKKTTTNDIIKAVEKAGFSAYTEEKKLSKESGDGFTDEKTRLIISICFLVPLMYISMGHMWNLPLSELEQISYAKTTPLFVYCHSGARSSQACRYLKQKGYQAENIGGIVSYRGAFG